MKRKLFLTIGILLTTALLVPSAIYADSFTCNLAGYKAMPGVTAEMAGNSLLVTWEGDSNQQLRLRLSINTGTPTIQELAIRRNKGAWIPIATNLTPEFRVASGFRRMDQEQIPALRELGPITQEVVDHYKWDAFWDAPLHLPGDEPAHVGSTPPKEGIANQPGLPRKPEEVHRDTATYKAQNCDVKTNGSRLEISFPGVQLGVFAGRLQYTVYKGTNLIRQEVIAKTEDTSVAYKYDGGLRDWQFIRIPSWCGATRPICGRTMILAVP